MLFGDRNRNFLFFCLMQIRIIKIIAEACKMSIALFLKKCPLLNTFHDVRVVPAGTGTLLVIQ